MDDVALNLAIEEFIRYFVIYFVLLIGTITISAAFVIALKAIFKSDE